MTQIFDHIIVGGGSAGSVLASRLSEDPAVNVALLEAGAPDSSVLIHCPGGLPVLGLTGQYNWSFDTVPQPGLGGRRGFQPRGKVLGGSSSINAMIYIRGQHEDYDHWAQLGNPGWAWDDVLPYFRRAEHNERGADAWHGADGPLNVMDLKQPNRFSRAFVQAAVQAGHTENRDFNAASQEGVGLYQVTHRNGERFSAAKAYLTPHLKRPNLQVLTGAVATRICFEGRRATGVVVRRDGQESTLTAQREVLLAAGALQSAPLLLHSGIGPGAELQALGIPTLHHLPGVGRHLHDHIDIVQIVDAPHLKDLFGVSLTGTWRTLQGILEWRRQRTGMLATNFAEAGGFIRSGQDVTTPDLQFHFVIGKIMNHGRKPVFGHGYSCHVCLLRPRSRGHVRLASRDPLAPPLIDPNFLSERDDVDRLVAGFRKMRTVLQQPALASHGGRELAATAVGQTDAQIEQVIRRYADTVYHPVGSCRMGPDPGHDVVDAQLRVHGLAGLRVVDASIMPRIVSGNTNAPVIMIAEKAADMIQNGG